MGILPKCDLMYGLTHYQVRNGVILGHYVSMFSDLWKFLIAYCSAGFWERVPYLFPSSGTGHSHKPAILVAALWKSLSLLCGYSLVYSEHNCNSFCLFLGIQNMMN